jgi:hypothetical protein
LFSTYPDQSDRERLKTCRCASAKRGKKLAARNRVAHQKSLQRNTRTMPRAHAVPRCGRCGRSGYSPCVSRRVSLSSCLFFPPLCPLGKRKTMGKSTQNRFRILTHYLENCPWCFRVGVLTSAQKKSVLHVCANGCGYIAPKAKAELSYRERIKYYDPKRFQKIRKPTEPEHSRNRVRMAEKMDACIRESRRRLKKERYSRAFKSASQRGWSNAKHADIVSSLPTEGEGSGPLRQKPAHSTLKP